MSPSIFSDILVSGAGACLSGVQCFALPGSGITGSSDPVKLSCIDGRCDGWINGTGGGGGGGGTQEPKYITLGGSCSCGVGPALSPWSVSKTLGWILFMLYRASSEHVVCKQSSGIDLVHVV